MREDERDTGSANLLIGPGRWRSRGYLPHFDSPEAIQHVTFHLADSLPKEALDRLDGELRAIPARERDGERRRRLEAWIDAGHGSCLLAEAAIAEMVQDALLSFDGQRYSLLAWAVMPNHVHALFQPSNGWALAKIVASWKKYTARVINDHRRPLTPSAEIRVPPLPVWHREYWDRYVRDERHFQRTVGYIHENPVKAGLVEQPEDWQWSSAHLGAGI